MLIPGRAMTVMGAGAPMTGAIAVGIAGMAVLAGAGTNLGRSSRWVVGQSKIAKQS